MEMELDISGTGLGYFLNKDKNIGNKNSWSCKTAIDDNSVAEGGVCRKSKINWLVTVVVVLYHVAGFWGLKLVICGQFAWATAVYSLLMGEMAGLGVTAGIHRLWSHKAFKARAPLRILLAILFTLSKQGPIWLWVATHRVHHKYSDTEKDPHNVNRGFWYSHIGWLFLFDYKTLLYDAKVIDMSDIQSDPIVMWQSRYYYLLLVCFAYPVPSLLPWLLWGETLETSIFLGCSFSHMLLLHSTFAVNSFAHLYGSKPHDESIEPSQNGLVAFMAMGEGWHNFHHTFPWDYRTAELGFYNPTTTFIDFFSKFGWAYDLKTVSQDVIIKRSQRTGDGSHASQQDQHREAHRHLQITDELKESGANGALEEMSFKKKLGMTHSLAHLLQLEKDSRKH